MQPDVVSEIPNPAVLPAGFEQCSVVFGPDAQFPGIELPVELTAAVRQRRMQFLAGRYCAAQAIARLCGPGADTSVPRGTRGVPVWPGLLTGSITHTRDFAWAAVARRTTVASVGIDTEQVVAADQGRRVASLVLTAAELRIPDPIDEPTWVTLVFAAKEALFKCLNPVVGRYIDYSGAVIRPEGTASGRLSATLLESLSPALPSGRTLTGAFELKNGYVHAAIWLPA
jgi:enterobactin synthetase component D